MAAVLVGWLHFIQQWIMLELQYFEYTSDLDLRSALDDHHC
jgi:hypothetical protein|tara:strand:+ start:570 stop:692 length:123 start_codon:yes stop_codon:yes gene_type:complete